MSGQRLPNVPYTDRLAGEPFYIYCDSSALLQGRGFSRMTPLTRRLSSHLQSTSSNRQPNGDKSTITATPSKLRTSKPRLMLMGQRRSGKSSITSVVFHKMPPQETLFLESTTRIQKDFMHSFMDFQIWDFPGQLDYFDPDYDDAEIFTGVGALIWVIDAQDEYEVSCQRLTTTILNVRPLYPDMHIEVFVHKIDALNAELKADVFNDIQQLVEDNLNDQDYTDIPVSYHLTSIYDHSIFEALSKVMQKLIRQLPTFENLLNILVNSCGMEKAYLFDTQTKTYIGSDTRPIDMEVYEMCSDFIDVIVDTSELFGWVREDENSRALGPQMDEVESTVTVHNDTMIYLKEMNRYLCLVTVIKNPAAKDKKGLIDYNCHIFQDALGEVFEKAWAKKKEFDDRSISALDQGTSLAAGEPISSDGISARS